MAIGTVPIRYAYTGDGPTIVLCHGITDSGPCWARLAGTLRDDYRVVSYDARGHGSSGRTSTYSVRDHVADLLDMLDTLAPIPVALVGHSMGGVTATWAAVHRRNSVSALVVEDPHWPIEPEREGDYDLTTWEANLRVDNARPFAELVAIGRRDNPLWDESDLVPWAQAKQ